MSRLVQLKDFLGVAWCSAPSVCEHFKWSPHTLRGAVSQANTKWANAGEPARIIRMREDGVTFYRLSQDGQL